MLLFIDGIECEWSNRYTRRNRENRLKQYIERKETCTIVETTAAGDCTIVPSSFNTSVNPFLLINLLSSHFPLIRFYLSFSLFLFQKAEEDDRTEVPRRRGKNVLSMRTEITTHGKIEKLVLLTRRPYYQDAKGQTQFHFCILVSRDCVAPRARAFSSFLSRTQQRARARTHTHNTHILSLFFSPFVLKSNTRESSKSQSRPTLVTLRFSCDFVASTATTFKLL